VTLTKGAFMDFVRHIVLHLPVAALAVLTFSIARLALPRRARLAALVAILVAWIVYTLRGEGVGAISHQMAYFAAAGIVYGVYRGARAALRRLTAVVRSRRAPRLVEV
jgi:hypothetical protein